MLLKQLSGGAPQVEKTRILAKQPILGALLNAGGQFLARNDLQRADQRVAEITQAGRQQAQNEYAAATQELMGAPDKNAAIAKFMASGNPMVRALAQAELKAMREAEEKRREQQNSRANALLPVLGGRGMVGEAAQIARTGEVPQQMNVPQPVPPKVNFIPDPNNPGKFLPHQIDTKLTGEQSGTLGQAGTNVSISNNLPGAPGRVKEILTKANVELLKKERIPQARAAQVALGNIARIIEELQKGAETGSWQDQKQLLAKIGTLFGVDAPKLGTIDNVKKALFENVFQKAQALRPVSNEELAILKEQVGSIDTDPQALAHILSWYNAQALRTLQELDESLAPYAVDENAALWEGLRGNIKMPERLNGPLWFQLRTLQDLQRAGGNIAQFKQGSSAVPADAQFDIRGSAQGLQRASSTNRGAPLVDKPIEQMSLEELQQRLNQLKGQ